MGVLGALLLIGTMYDLTYRIMSWVLLTRLEQMAQSESAYTPIGGEERAPLLAGRSSNRPGAVNEEEDPESLLPAARSNAITPGFLAPDTDEAQQPLRWSGASTAAGAGARDRSSLDDPRPQSVRAGDGVGRQTAINAAEEDAGGEGGRRAQRSPRPWRHGMLGRVLLCFSLPANISKIFHVEANGEQLDILHGMRFVSMLWVIWGHTYVFAANYSGVSLLSIKCFHIMFLLSFVT